MHNVIWRYPLWSSTFDESIESLLSVHAVVSPFDLHLRVTQDLLKEDLEHMTGQLMANSVAGLYGQRETLSLVVEVTLGVNF